jgi:hypothetical protein
MPRIAHRAAPHLGTVLALATLGAFTTAAAQTGSFEPWVLVNEGCTQLVNGKLELRTCYEPGDLCDWSNASLTATVPGTFLVDLVWDITGVKECTQCIITVDSQLGWVFVKDAPLGTDAWCEPQPCGGATKDISFEVAAGDVVRFQLTNNGEPCGPDGRLLLDARSPNHRDVGHSVSGGADLDGDGRGDLLLGLMTPAGVSRVLALDAEVALQAEPQLRAEGSLQPGMPLTLRVNDGPPQALALFVLGSTAQDLPLFGGIVVPAADLLVLGPLTDASGRFEVTSRWPTGPAALLSLVVQAWMTSSDAASGFEATNAVALTQ